ncbi:hypothetical protein P692DRAFT_20817314 [Suillus brevipes Sb2]|nr:hypothetical protein P692DRAFT_20817314 [Suillus brevipes Sb2]
MTSKYTVFRLPSYRTNFDSNFARSWCRGLPVPLLPRVFRIIRKFATNLHQIGTVMTEGVISRMERQICGPASSTRIDRKRGSTPCAKMVILPDSHDELYTEAALKWVDATSVLHRPFKRVTRERVHQASSAARGAVAILGTIASILLTVQLA